jgi:hypothetical protein
MPAEVPVERFPVSSDYRFPAERVAAAFSDRGEFSHWNQSARFKVVELPAVAITSGQVVADDPLFGWGAPLLRRVPQGTYPISLALVQLASGDERIAFARMLLAPEAVVAWETAWREAIPQTVMRDGKPHDVRRQYSFFCSSETGFGCYMDAAALPALRNCGMPACLTALQDGFKDNYRDTWSWFSFKPNPSGRENVVCYSTEPGCWHSHFGLDASGNAAVIVTDFRMF